MFCIQNTSVWVHRKLSADDLRAACCVIHVLYGISAAQEFKASLEVLFYFMMDQKFSLSYKSELQEDHISTQTLSKEPRRCNTRRGWFDIVLLK